MTPKPVCNALWVGPSIGPIEQTCLSSFIEAGHRVDLYAYDVPSGVPRGVNVVDAATILPREAIIRYEPAGSYALFSNRFRYALLRAGRGVWIDCDVLCLRALADAPFLYARQDDGLINGAVLKLPVDHPVLVDLLAMFTTAHWIPPWLSFPRRLACRVRYHTQRDFGISHMAFGTSGPRGLTYYLGKHGLSERAQPTDAFYPIGWRESDCLARRDPGGVRGRITARTSCIHLWTHARSERDVRVEPGSFLDAVIEGSWRDVLGAVNR